ncbi:immunoglobulin-like domain-containing protein [Motilimonas pumila]|uniref:immunoglobulin-like domain-containing protein n=1 Tax=Motilimonas pumila TaxID=2303987 RepID=UPI0013140926|nr:immunoglobulin-like domain-containing protein [Motilimonas pumila]
MSACGGGGGSDSSSASGDTLPPEVRLNGNAQLNISWGSNYEELGAVATDDVDGALSVNISGSVDTNVLGQYTLVYSATDTSGNTTSISRVVTVEDLTPPNFELIGGEAITHSYNTDFIEPGVSAFDLVDGALEVTTSGRVNQGELGDYVLTYTAVDHSGNSATIERTVSVVDDLQPTINLIGERHITVKAGADYMDPGAIAIDNYDGDISASIEVTNNVNTAAAGNYDITYKVEDSQGNFTYQTRNVVVIEPVYSYKMLDQDITLWESGYEHTLVFKFDEVSAFERQVRVEVSTDSTATEDVDFKVLTTNLLVEAGSLEGKVRLRILDDALYEGEETINLDLFDDRDINFGREQIILSDESVPVTEHAELSGEYLAPMVAAIDHQLYVSNLSNIESYNLITEESLVLKTSYIGSHTYGDAISYKGDVYAFDKGQLYLLDRETSTFNRISTAPTELDWSPQIEVVGDELFIFGGMLDSVNESTNRVQIYNFLTGRWRFGKDLPFSTSMNAVAQVDGKLYVFPHNTFDTAGVRYNPATDTWSELPLLPERRNLSGVAVASGKYIYVVNDTDLNDELTTSLYRLDVESLFWELFEVNTPSKWYQDGLLYKGKVYLIGGNRDSVNTKSVVSLYLGDD